MRIRAAGTIFLLLLRLTGTAAEPTPVTSKPSDPEPAELFALGTKFAKGTGVQKDPKEAVKCFARAAELGDPAAQDRLGTIFANGDGVPRDYIEALAWYNLAASGGTKAYVDNRDALERKIGIDATVAAQLRSRLILERIERARVAREEAKVAPPPVVADPLAAQENRKKLEEENRKKFEEEVAAKLGQGKAPTPSPDGRPAAERTATLSVPKKTPRSSANSTMPGNMGILGQDAQWSNYGEYLQEFLEIVEVQWKKIVAESHVSPPHGSHVVVTFKINSKGEIEMVSVDDAGSGKKGVFSCTNAVMARQPYRKWTEQMIAVLGDEQQITLSFSYQ